MKIRVALTAALLALIALVAVSVASVAKIPGTLNANKKRDMVATATTFSMALEMKAAEEDRVEFLTGVNMLAGDVLGFFSSDGTFLYATDDRLSLPEEALKAVVKKSPVTGVLSLDESKKLQYAACSLEDGSIFLYCSGYNTLGDLLKDNRTFVWVLILVILVSFTTIWIIICNDRQYKLFQRVMATLDEFSEGNFDTRIPHVAGTGDLVVSYNATLDRLQTRIFGQMKRNQVLGAIISQMQNGIIAVDQNLNVTLVTGTAKQLLGIVGRPEGKNVRDASNDVKLDEVFSEAMQQCGVYTNDVAARTAMGRGHRPLRLYVSPMRQDGKVVGAMALVEDVTELRRMEEMRVDFAANVSHELKTPLTSIRGFVETLDAGAIDNPQMAHKFLRIIMMETERLTHLINDILSISKLESGRDEVEISKIRIDKMAFEVCDMLQMHAQDKEITLNCNEHDEPIYIKGNNDRVEQMLINLIENGIKYNQPGGSVTVQVTSDNANAYISIADTGIGIAEEHIPRLFERFYRVDKGRSRQMGGTGLGLAIVKHIVVSMGGTIEVHSRLDEGTEFLVTLPIAADEAETGERIAELSE